MPSSQNYVPFPDENVKAGCIDLQELSFTCYCLPANIPVTENQWSFPKNTFIYGKWINDLEVNLLEETYRIEHVDYEVIGKFKEDIYHEILNCFLKR